MDEDFEQFEYEAVLQTFVAETAEQFREIEDALISLERTPTDREAMNRIFRLVHTLKGSSSCLNLPVVSRCAHAFEDVLGGFREHPALVTAHSVTALLETVDCLKRVVAGAVSGDDEIPAEYQTLLDRISAFTSRGTHDPLRSGRDELPEFAGVDPGPAYSAFPSSQIDQANTLRIDSAKLDRMLNLTSEILTARGRLREVLQARKQKGSEDVWDSLEALDNLFSELQDLIMKSRMVPLGPIFRQHARTVRDLAAATGKSARMVIEGEESEVDTSIAEHLRDPLTHLIRNAVDHGIEPPDVRLRNGKDPRGLVKVGAYRHGGSIVIQVSDDGSGLDSKKIAEQAFRRGLISDRSTISEQELHRLIFLPAFSTAETVTEVSGRGVGMDIVCRRIEAIHGSVEVESQGARGTTFTIRLPLTLAIVDGFIVGVGEEQYVIPMAAVTECVDLADAGRPAPEPSGLLNLRGEALPYIRLRRHFDVGGESPERESVVVVKHETGLTGLAVDALHGKGQVVVKPLGKLFRQVPGVSASTILSSGRVALVLDIPALVRESTRQARV